MFIDWWELEHAGNAETQDFFGVTLTAHFTFGQQNFETAGFLSCWARDIEYKVCNIGFKSLVKGAI